MTTQSTPARTYRRFTLDLDIDLHRRARVAMAEDGLILAEVMRTLLTVYLDDRDAAATPTPPAFVPALVPDPLFPMSPVVAARLAHDLGNTPDAPAAAPPAAALPTWAPAPGQILDATAVCSRLARGLPVAMPPETSPRLTPVGPR